MKATKWEDYRNPDPQCTYPWSPGPAGYCWSWANHFDGAPKFADIQTICKGCECYASQLAEADQQPTTTPAVPPSTAAGVA